jgi:hypothetical protein
MIARTVNVMYDEKQRAQSTLVLIPIPKKTITQLAGAT